MATESLIVLLDARTAKLDAKLKTTEGRLDQLDNSVKKTDKSFSNFTKGAAAAAAAVVTVAAAIGVAVKSASDFAKELDIASNRTGDSVERLQELAFATNTVGVSLEKLGDIGKDVNEKIAEFIATGSGGFQDFADVMKFTTIQAEEMSEKFVRMSGTEVLQSMVQQMEEAEVGTSKMSFALEGMASDTTDLIPLLINGSSALKSLSSEFAELDVTLSKLDVQKIREVGKEFDKFTDSFGRESQMQVARYSAEIIKALDVMTFLGKKSIDAFNVIASGWGGLVDVAGAALNDIVNGVDTLPEALRESAEANREAINEFLGEDFYQIGVNAGNNLANGIADGYDENSGSILDIVVKGGKQLSSWEKLDTKQRVGVYQGFIKASSILSEQYLEDNRGVRSALVVMDTAAGITRAYAESPFWVATAQAAVMAASGLVQLSNIKNANKGGGSISNGGGGAGSGSQPEPEQISTQEASIRVIGDESSTSIQQIEFISDGGSPAEDLFSMALNEGVKRGSVRIGADI